MEVWVADSQEWVQPIVMAPNAIIARVVATGPESVTSPIKLADPLEVETMEVEADAEVDVEAAIAMEATGAVAVATE